MRRLQLILFAILALVGVLVLTFALRNRQPPMLPEDADHSRTAGTEACSSCHGAEGALPRGPNHPNGFDCLRCHGSR